MGVPLRDRMRELVQVRGVAGDSDSRDWYFLKVLLD